MQVLLKLSLILALLAGFSAGNFFDKISAGSDIDFEDEKYKKFENEFNGLLEIEDVGELRTYHVQRMLKFMNSSVDPCNNFFEFACGNFGAYVNETIMDDDFDVATFINIRLLENLIKAEQNNEGFPKQVKEFYDICMTKYPYSRNNVGLLDVILNTPWKGNDDVIVAEHQLLTLNRVGVLTELVESHKQGTEKLKLKKPNDEVPIDQIRSYFDLSQESLRNMMQNVTDLQQEIADIVKNVDEEDVKGLDLLDPEDLAFDPTFLIDPNRAQSGSDTNNDDMKLEIVDPVATGKVLRILRTANLGTLYNYYYLQILYQFTQRLNMLRDQPANERSFACSRMISQLMPFETSYIFGRKYFSDANKNDVTQVVDGIRDELRHHFNSSKWLDRPTKREAIRKLDNIFSVIGAPEYVGDEDVIETRGRNLDLNDSKDFLETFFSALLADHSNSPELLVDSPINNITSASWSATEPIQANAFYSSAGAMIIPLGILVPPFWHLKFPQFFKYGHVGMLIGHEFMHAFDNHGIEYDSDFKKRKWFSRRLDAKRIRNMECFYSQYNKDYKVDSILTMSENLPDNIGLELAFTAYKTWAESVQNADEIEMNGYSELGMDKYQAYFLAAAQSFCSTNHDHTPNDPHAPLPVRVMGTLSNSPDFAKAFNCPKKSGMNPKRRCKYLS